MPVLAAAARHGLVPSLWVSGLSVLAYNLFFLPPLYQFTVADPANVVGAVRLHAGGGRRQRARPRAALANRGGAARGAHHRRALCLQPQIAGVIDLEDLLWIGVTPWRRLLDAEVVILMPARTGSSTVSARPFRPTGADEAELAAARWSWDADRPTGRGTDTLPGCTLAVRADPHQPFGRRRDRRAAQPRRPIRSAPPEQSLLDAVGNQAAVAIERLTLAEDSTQARLGAERERMRSAMLTSVSHDLRTPLASIIGSLSSLRSYRDRYDKGSRDELRRRR